MDTGSLWKNKTGPRRITKTPGNVERVRQAVMKSPKRIPLKRAAKISNLKVGQILHEDLKPHPNKLAMVKNLINAILLFVLLVKLLSETVFPLPRRDTFSSVRMRQ